MFDNELFLRSQSAAEAFAVTGCVVGCIVGCAVGFAVISRAVIVLGGSIDKDALRERKKVFLSMVLVISEFWRFFEPLVVGWGWNAAKKGDSFRGPDGAVRGRLDGTFCVETGGSEKSAGAVTAKVVYVFSLPFVCCADKAAKSSTVMTGAGLR